MQALKNIAVGVLIGFIASALILLVASPPRGSAIELLPTSTQTPINVYVTGAVQAPGLYTLPPGNRVADAIAAAGGTLPEADLASINLAQRLMDGQKIDVLKLGEATEPARNAITNNEPIDLNIASLEQLDQLPGIGPSKAADIIAYRQKIGGFDTIEQILDVPGIGPVLFDKIKDLITVSP